MTIIYSATDSEDYELTIRLKGDGLRFRADDGQDSFTSVDLTRDQVAALVNALTAWQRG